MDEVIDLSESIDIFEECQQRSGETEHVQQESKDESSGVAETADGTNMDIFKAPAELSMTGNLKENWRKYKQNFDIFMTATKRNKEPQETQVAVFLSLVGEAALDTYNTFTLTADDKKNLKKVMDAFETYCNPRKNIVYERFIFYNRKQAENEPFDNFLTDISNLVKNCEFNEQPADTASISDTMLRDRIVLGHSDRGLQEKLLQIENLDLKKAIEVCRIHEVAKSQNKELQSYGGGTSRTKGASADAVQTQAGGNLNTDSMRCNKNTFTQSKGGKNNTMTNKYTRKQKGSSEQANKNNCNRCLKKHENNKCPAYGQSCYKCNKLNHFASACRNKFVREITCDDQYVHGVTVNTVLNNNDGCWFQNLKVENMAIRFKLDSGSEVNIIPLNIFKKFNKKFKLAVSSINLEAYGGFQIKPIGSVQLRIENKKEKLCQDFVVVDVLSHPILSLSTCVKLGLIKRIDKITTLLGGTGDDTKEKETFIQNNRDTFEGLGRFPELAQIELKDDAVPVARPPRRIALCISDKVKKKLRDMVHTGIISKVINPADWVHNMVVVEKKDNSLRLCIDPHELNKHIKRNYVLMPTLEELSHKLRNMQYFSVLDLKEGFWQVEMTEKAKSYCTFSTPFGCYRFNRLPFGIASAPEIFQNLNTKSFCSLQGVFVYMDDILVFGRDRDEHDRNLNAVIEQARSINVKFNPNKFQYCNREVKYVGHVFSSEGIKPDPERIKAIIEMKYPKNKEELQSFLGTVNYVGNFIPNLAEINAPLRALIKKNVEFQWFASHAQAVDRLKNALVESPVLQNFDAKLEVTIEADASKNGVGCVLLQAGRPIFYASKSLNSAEINYSQTEKEFLAIVYACKRFHYFVYGMPTIIVHTDHKPLVSIMEKDVCQIQSVRLQRMRIKLLPYNLKLRYIQGKNMHISDFLSRNFLAVEGETVEDINEMVHSVNVSDRRRLEIEEQTKEDTDLQVIRSYCVQGWPKDKTKVPENIKAYYKLRNDIFYEDNLLFYEDRIVVPTAARKKILNILHESHMGMTKTKARAKSLFYWPNLNQQVENLVASCSVCEKYRASKVNEPLIPHDIPDLPFEKVGCDILEYGGSNYLILIDYFSKYLEINKMVDKTSKSVISEMKKIFSTHGIPKEIVCDNMPFSSYECKKFSEEWHFSFVHSSPRYPRSNGMAEKAVHIAKNILRKTSESNQDYLEGLLEYRCTPLEGVGYSPAQILMSRQLRTKLPVTNNKLSPMLTKNVQDKLKTKQKNMKKYHDQRIKKENHTFAVNDKVVYQHDTANNKIWLPGKVIKKHSNRSFYIENENRNILRRNTVHLRKSLTARQVNAEGKPQDQTAKKLEIPHEHEPQLESDRPITTEHYVTRSGREVRPVNRYQPTM